MSGQSIGALRHRLTLEAPLRTPGEGGTATLMWSVVATVPARIAPAAGREIASADGVAGRITHRIRIRWMAGVLPAMRLTGGGRTFEIQAVTDVGERRRWLDCLCLERVP